MQNFQNEYGALDVRNAGKFDMPRGPGSGGTVRRVAAAGEVKQ